MTRRYSIAIVGGIVLGLMGLIYDAWCPNSLLWKIPWKQSLMIPEHFENLGLQAMLVSFANSGFDKGLWFIVFPALTACFIVKLLEKYENSQLLKYIESGLAVLFIGACLPYLVIIPVFLLLSFQVGPLSALTGLLRLLTSPLALLQLCLVVIFFVVISGTRTLMFFGFSSPSIPILFSIGVLIGIFRSRSDWSVDVTKLPKRCLSILVAALKNRWHAGWVLTKTDYVVMLIINVCIWSYLAFCKHS